MGRGKKVQYNFNGTENSIIIIGKNNKGRATAPVRCINILGVPQDKTLEFIHATIRLHLARFGTLDASNIEVIPEKVNNGQETHSPQAE